MDAQALVPERRDEWDGVAERSDDAWFWHMTSWLDFTQELGRKRLTRNLSFFVTENSQILAICPVIMEQVNAHRQLTYLQEFIPFPAFQNGVSEAKRQAVVKFYVRTLASLANEHDVAYVRIGTPSLAPSHLRKQMPVVSPLLRFGYWELPYAAQVLDLTQSVDELRADVRKGHRSDIKRASQLCAMSMWDSTNVTDHKFREYRELHEKDAGRVTRSRHSFDLMLGWIRQENAVLAEVSCGGAPVAFALIILFGTGAYYGSACKDPDHRKLPSSHLLQWESIVWLKERQFRYYDLGPQYFNAQWCHVPSPKQISISNFKRGFGGRTVRVPMAEFYFSTTLLEGHFQQRLRDYVASRKPCQ